MQKVSILVVLAMSLLISSAQADEALDKAGKRVAGMWKMYVKSTQIERVKEGCGNLSLPDKKTISGVKDHLVNALDEYGLQVKNEDQALLKVLDIRKTDYCSKEEIESMDAYVGFLNRKLKGWDERDKRRKQFMENISKAKKIMEEERKDEVIKARESLRKSSP